MKLQKSRTPKKRRTPAALRRLARGACYGGALALAVATGSTGARADKIKHPIAVFSGLDKITGRIIAFEVKTDETVQFGSLQITERACLTRPATEAPQTTTFIEVDEVDASGEYKRIFSGWMYAASPGLHAIEHPVYDIWLTDCKGGGEVLAAPDAAATESAQPGLDNAKTPPDAKISPEPKSSPDAKPKSVVEPARKPAPRPRRAAPPAGEFGGELPPQGDPGRGAPIEVRPPPGLIPNVPPNVPVERRAPAQRYYPTGPAAPVRPDRGDGF